MKNMISNTMASFVSDSYNVEPWILKFNDDETNYIWHTQNGESLGTAVCFPLLGSLPDKKYFLDGKEYTMESHGFAGKMEYEVVEKSDDKIVYEIADNEITYEQYPYRFRFQVVYSLKGAILKTEYRIKNNDIKEMFFSVGGHPRFACPIEQGDFDNYYVEFDSPISVEHIVKSYGSIDIIEKFISEDRRKIRMNHSMFIDGCFCLHPVPKNIALKNSEDSRSLSIKMDNATHFQFWTTVGGSYIALEPWYGSITSIPAKPIESDWIKRPGTLHVSPGCEYGCSYYVIIAK